jgi:hypothetical protein
MVAELCVAWVVVFVATLLMTTRLLLVMIRLMRFLSSFDMEELSYDVYSKSEFTLILNGQHVS